MLKEILSRCNAPVSFIVFFHWKKKKSRHFVASCRQVFHAISALYIEPAGGVLAKNIVSSEVVIIILQFVYDCMILLVAFLHEEIKGHARAEKPVLRISAWSCRCKSTLSTRSTSQGKRRQRKKKNRVVAEEAISRLSNARTRPR